MFILIHTVLTKNNKSLLFYNEVCSSKSKQIFLLRLHSITAFPDMIVDKNLRLTAYCMIFDRYITYKRKGNEAKQEEN